MKKGTKLLPAVCVGCGWKGKSQHPETYRCSGCYYENVANASIACAERHESKAKRERLDAEEYAARAIVVRQNQKRKP